MEDDFQFSYPDDDETEEADEERVKYDDDLGNVEWVSEDDEWYSEDEDRFDFIS